MAATIEQQPDNKLWAEILVLTAYAFAMWGTILLSFKFGIATNEVVAIWPAAGIGVWVAVQHGWKSLPAVFASHLGYSITHQGGIDPYYLITNMGNAIAYYLPVVLSRRWGESKDYLTTVPDVMRLICVLAVGTSIISAFIGSLSLYYFYNLTALDLWRVVWRWFFSDFTGVIIIFPILAALQREPNESVRELLRQIVSESALPAMLSVALVVVLYFSIHTMPDSLGQYPIVLLTMPFCVWLALRAGQRGVSLLLSAVTIGSLTLTLLAVGDVSESAFLAVQLYGMVVMCTSLILHATAHEKNAILVELDGERSQLESKVAQRTSELQELAETDTLTGLANRRLFEDRLAEIFEDGQNDHIDNFLLFMDLDQFKIVNDTSGHAAGDELLKNVANILNSNVRDNDLVGRLGGDEFAILLSECPKDVALQIAEQIRGEVEEFRFHWENEIYKIGVSIGVALLDRQQNSVDEAQQIADAACYAAKNSGRNRVHFANASDGNVQAQRGEVRWAQRLNDAMENNRFVLYTQLIESTSDNSDEPDHVEILVRLRDPEKRQLVPPGAFLPAAERYGLATALDEWVVKNLLRTIYLHQAFDAKPRSYWINLSGSSVGDEKFVDFLIKSMKASPMKPGMINFEITETAVIRNLAEAGRLMNKLHEMGCKFALDDFGTGVSSFSHLKQLPVDYLKIDGAFIRDIKNDPVDQIFVKSIIDIAHSMGIKAIAEYVESEEIRAVVTDLGVDLVQGFAISEPKLLTPDFQPMELLQRNVG